MLGQDPSDALSNGLAAQGQVRRTIQTLCGDDLCQRSLRQVTKIVTRGMRKPGIVVVQVGSRNTGPHGNCTGTGTRLFVVELLPSWPASLLPQHCTLPLAIAQL